MIVFKPALLIIRTGVKFFLFRKYLLMKIRVWQLMSDVEYRMEHNHVVE